jgi:nucleosome binding factor SPN SPT16 subunit
VKQFWLLGYEFPTTLMLLTVDTLYVLTTQKKGEKLFSAILAAYSDNPIAKHLESLKGGRFPIEVLIRGKDAAENESLFVKITDIINNAGVSCCAIPQMISV